MLTQQVILKEALNIQTELSNTKRKTNAHKATILLNKKSKQNYHLQLSPLTRASLIHK